MDKLNAAWAGLKVGVNNSLPAYENYAKGMHRALGALPNHYPVPDPGDPGGGGNGTDEDIHVGPWLIKANDPLLPEAREALDLVQATGWPAAIVVDDPGGVRFQSTHRPAHTPSWAWGETYSNPPKCWINRDENARKTHYACVHEWAHSIDDRFFNQTIRARYLDKLGTDKGWASGKYTVKFCSVPLEGFADDFARAMCPGVFDGLLPGFFTVSLGRADYPWLLQLVSDVIP